MQRRTKILGAVAAAVVAGGSIAAVTTDDQPLEGETYDRAVAAAREHVGEGEVVETELGDGDAAYEVEIVLPDGSQVEVQLDGSFNVLDVEDDDDTGEDDD